MYRIPSLERDAKHYYSIMQGNFHMKKNIRLVALDMDGTLFNHQSQISADDQLAIREATANGIEVIISTGRPYIGLPAAQLASLGIRYAITSNGAAIYQLPDKICIYENCMTPEQICPLIDELQKKDIHMDAFINGNGYSRRACEAKIALLDMPESIRQYIRDTRTFTDDLADFIREHQLNVQKMTLNFYPLSDGTFRHREEVKELLASHPEITFLSGGYHNLEFTKTGTTKGAGLRFICDYLGLSIEESMAIGDTQNDIDILKTAAIGVAMGNARDDVKEIADYITLTNEDSGVAHAIRKFTNC